MSPAQGAPAEAKSSNINIMPSNCSRCSHNIQENDRLTARIDVLQAQLQTQSLGKGNFSEGKGETASVPPVNTDSSINLLAQSPQPVNFLMASGGKCCRNESTGVTHSAHRNFQPVFPIKQLVGVRSRAFSGLYSSCYGIWDDEASHH